jgi:hypothetical protein
MRWIAAFFRKLRVQLWLWLASLHVLMWKLSPARPIIDHDVRRWVELSPRHVGLLGLQSWKQFALLLWKFPTFRNLLYYRIRRERHWPSRLALEFARRTVVGVPAYIIRRDGKPVRPARTQRAARQVPHPNDIEQP